MGRGRGQTEATQCNYLAVLTIRTDDWGIAQDQSISTSVTYEWKLNQEGVNEYTEKETEGNVVQHTHTHTHTHTHPF